MGIFSFLTGAKDDEREATTEARPATGPETGPPEGERPVPDFDVPFTPPEAWNVDALTAPPPAPSGEPPRIGAPDAAQTAAFQGPIIEVIKTVYDPEIPVDIYELGLIYDIIVDADRNVLVKMTLTSPACPSAQQIPSEVRYKVKAVPDVTDAWVEIVWEPPWDKDRMSEAAKMALGMY
ncbi:MAG TPA: iron-sulfur cluster assembly protein [Vicinamibacterales bacterium]|nr:iron-sulfur cluster assembly protein [Vicinamibacterales bacterium]